MVARNDVSMNNANDLIIMSYLRGFPLQAIYCYNTEGRGPCYAVDGIKVCLQWFRTYLIIVTDDSENAGHSPVTVSSTNRYNLLVLLLNDKGIEGLIFGILFQRRYS